MKNDWIESVDNWVLTDKPVNLLKDLTNASVVNTDSIMIGFNSMDGLQGWPWFAGAHPDNETQLNDMLQLYITNQTQVDLLCDYYYPLTDFINASVAYYTMNADVCVICPSLIFMETLDNQVNHKKNNHHDKDDEGARVREEFVRVNRHKNHLDMNQRQENDDVETMNTIDQFVYYFRSPANPYLAGHGAELPFVFGHESWVSFWDEQWSANLSYSMISAWTNMAKYGTPNITNQWTDVTVGWKTFGQEQNVMVLDNDVRMDSKFLTNYRNDVCHFWWDQVKYGQVESLCFNNKAKRVYDIN